MADLKRNMIEIVTDVKQGELVTEKYLTPLFIPLEKVYEAVDLLEYIEMYAGTAEGERDCIKRMLTFVVDVYGNQFTEEQLYNGLHAPEALTDLQKQVMFIARGFQDDDKKKQVEQMTK
ncbi:phage tail assembly chaperone G [Alkalibacillus almallahensis]|uniref:phage tail assembly chaperone G n=1 Tax=Alkalibacillus almallahensis TaxID=1379154 RepID=UPI00141E6CF6|nr:hypothetical protein [Alkalibacillus almallahensis]NIK11195.1 hypothetical protein [Alkalibacillus almallahensis]